MMTSFVAPHVPLMGDPVWADHYKDKDIKLGPRTAPDVPVEVWEDYLKLCQSHSNSHLLTDESPKRLGNQAIGPTETYPSLQ